MIVNDFVKCYKCGAMSEEESLMYVFLAKRVPSPVQCVDRGRCERRQWRRVRPRAMSKQLRARIDAERQKRGL